MKLLLDTHVFLWSVVQQTLSEKAHCQKIAELPTLHGDPFDRLLIAQALCEQMTLLSADANIQRYPVPTLW